MKRTFYFIVTAAIVLSIAVGFMGCLSTSESNSSGGEIPEPIHQARINTPEDAFVGIGTAHLETIDESRYAAIDMALGDIALQIETRVEYISTHTYSTIEVGNTSTLSDVSVSRIVGEDAIEGAKITEEYLSPMGGTGWR